MKTTSYFVASSIHLLPIFLFAIAPITNCLGQTSSTVKVPVHEGTNMALALSPDKKTIAVDLQGTIYTLPFAGGKLQPMTDGLGDERQPSWSPDGKEIVFQSYRDGTYHLWTVHPDGTGLQQLTFGVFDEREPQWSPDGERIIFSSDRSGNYDVWELNVKSNTLRQITTDAGNDYNPAYSPDGKTIAFISDRPEGGLFIKDESEKRLLPLKGTYYAPSWSVDGKGVSLVRMFDGKSDLIFVYTDGTSTTLAAGEDVFPFRTAWISNQEILYTSDGKIQKRNLQKKTLQSIPFEATLTLTKSVYPRKQRNFDDATPHAALGINGPVVSPDGKSIAFSALGNLWLLHPTSSTPEAITNDAAMEIDPSWSPDGKQLAYVSDRSEGKMTIYVRDMNNGTERQFANSAISAAMPCWSPDGKTIAFLSVDSPSGLGTTSLWSLDIATGEAKIVYKGLTGPGKPTWSADSKQIALAVLQKNSSRFREGITKLMIVPLDGSPVRYVSPIAFRSMGQRGKNGPVWSPDGHKLAFVQEGVLWTVNVNASGEPISFPIRLTNELAESPSWTGDSQSIVFIATDRLKKVSLLNGVIEDIPLSLTWKNQIPQGRIIIHAGKIFNGASSTYQKNMDVVIDGNRITEIVPHLPSRTGTVIDASDKTVMPGIFEMHTHETGSGGELLGRTWLAYGITSLRETGGDPYDALEQRESWASGVRPGPRAFITGPLIDGERIYYDLASSNTAGAQFEMELNRAAVLSYDLVKTYVRLPDHLQKRAIQFAHDHGMPVSSHEIYPASQYGVDAVEHISATSRRGYSPKISLRNYSYEDVIQIISKSGINITPTLDLSGGFGFSWANDSKVTSCKQLNALNSDAYREAFSNLAKQFLVRPESAERYTAVKSVILKLLKAGAHITAGTDSPILPYGLSLHMEIQNLVEAGFTPFEALRSATLWSAEAIGVEKDLGSIEVGKLADLIIIKGDPLKDVHDAMNVETVFKNGIRYEINQLLKK